MIVDDDERMCRLLENYLGAAGYQVQSAHNGDEMYQYIKLKQPDLVLLDLSMPGTHGLDLARDLRRKSNVGIIILTGSGEDVDKIVGLEIGADDYMQKPFDSRELLARIRSVLRRYEHPQYNEDAHTTVEFSGFILDQTSHKLTDSAGKEIELTGHEYMLLEVFVHNANRVMSRDQIMDKIYDRDWIPSDRAVDVLIAKLRNKIEKDTRKPEIIKTIRGSGYMMTSRIEFLL